MDFEKIYSSLNEAQKSAVDHIEGPAMVIAGPGTGKTQILGARSANLILNAGIDASNIFITTFTEAGVVAIKKRLLDMIGPEANKIYVSTIHSFADDVIHTFPDKFPDFENSTSIDQLGQYEIIDEIVNDLFEKNEIKFIKNTGNIYSAIGDLKKEGISTKYFNEILEQENIKFLEELEEKRHNKRIKKIENHEKSYEDEMCKYRELALIYEIYEKKLSQEKKYDFNDMINFVLEKIKIDDDLKYYYAEKFQYIMVDEFQDTNNAQTEIIDQILSVGPDKDMPNIMVVGDDDQSIYRFQGANLENMLNFKIKYPRTSIIVMDTNYRSNQQILNSVNTFIENNNERLVNRIDGITKFLHSPANLGNNKPIFYGAFDSENEKLFILEEIKKLQKENKSLDEIAIILRTNKEVKEYSEFLLNNGFPVCSKDDTNILNSEYVNFIIKFLKIIENPYSDDNIFIDVLRNGIIKVDKIDIIMINKYLSDVNYVRKNKLKIWDFLRKIEENITDLEKKDYHFNDKQKLIDFKNLFIELYEKKSEINLNSFFCLFLEKNNILEYIEKNGNFDDIIDIYSLQKQIQERMKSNHDFGITNLYKKISLHKKFSLSLKRYISKSQTSGIQIMTGHASKGLEFETVFIPGLIQGNWDNKKSPPKIKLPRGIIGTKFEFENEKQEKEQKKISALNEDRRLFFVALSRAKSNLFLSFPKSKDNKIATLKSQFLDELKDTVTFIDQENYDENGMQNLLINELKRNQIKLEDNLETELSYLKIALEKYKLSATDFNNFLENPYTFYKNVILKYPGEQNENLVFGNNYHKVLELFFKKYKNDKVLPSVSYMTSNYIKLLKNEILTPGEYERLEKKGLESINGYYEKYLQNFNKEILEIEYSFTGKNLFYKNVPIKGKIDKIEKNAGFVDSEDGIFRETLFKESVNIVDYKTGSVKSELEIKGIDSKGNKKDFSKGRFGRQLMFYRLLCESDKDFSSKYAISSLCLEFVEGKNGKYDYKVVNFTDEEYEEFKNLVVETREKIIDVNFWREVLMSKKKYEVIENF